MYEAFNHDLNYQKCTIQLNTCTYMYQKLHAFSIDMDHKHWAKMWFGLINAERL